MKQKLTIIIHTLLQLLAFTSWLWLDYRIIAVLAAAHLIMLEVLKGCPLSHSQFPEDKDKRFYEWWLERFGAKLAGRRRRVVRIFMQYILPLLIVGLAVLVQVVAGFKPLFAI
jgi:hypothetical protein